MEQAKPSGANHSVRFDAFDVNSATGKLAKNGVPIHLPPQPLLILLLLLESPGAVITRDELRRQLWAPGTFVDFDRNLNSVMRKLRRALGDRTKNPKYIETVPRLGYRFIARVELPPTESENTKSIC